MTLVDTSAWVAFFRANEHPVVDQLDALLASGEVALCGPIVTEVRRGVRSRSDRERVILHMQGCELLEPPTALWEEAGELAFSLGRRGLSVKTLDLLIATYALAHEVPILTTDSDFVRMRKAGIPLRLV